jgi:tRNA 2-thiouridine synthesizing protein A
MAGILRCPRGNANAGGVIWVFLNFGINIAPMEFDRELDTRGLNCPLPILRTKKALNELQSGQVLKVVSTDPGSVKDFEAFSRQTGHQLVSHAEANKEFTFYVKRK